MENDHIILNVDSDNRRIELNLFKESTIIEIIDELIDKKEIIIEKILEIFNDKNNNYEVNLVYIDIIGKVFNDIIKETVFCTAPNDQRPILEGVNFTLNNKVLTATATDSYRLSRRQITLEEVADDKEFNLIIPRKALTYFQRMIEEGRDQVEIFYENNRIVLYYQNVVYTVLLISGNYPNTNKLIPTVFECTFVSNGRELFDAVDRVSLMSREDKDDIIKLIVKDNVLEISSQSKDLGSAVEEIKVDSTLEDDVFEISVSGRYLKEAIYAIASEEIIVKFSGELTAFIVQPADYHRDIIELILPVRTY